MIRAWGDGGVTGGRKVVPHSATKPVKGLLVGASTHHTANRNLNPGLMSRNEPSLFYWRLLADLGTQGYEET